LAGRDVLRVATMLDEPLGQFGAFAVGDHPTDDVATKNIQDDVGGRRSTLPGLAAW
jgi:hypothetical protein